MNIFKDLKILPFGKVITIYPLINSAWGWGGQFTHTEPVLVSLNFLTNLYVKILSHLTCYSLLTSDKLFLH